MINCHCRYWRAVHISFQWILLVGREVNIWILPFPIHQKFSTFREAPPEEKKHFFTKSPASSSHCIRGIFQQIWWKSFTKTQQCKSIQKLLQSRKANAKVHFLSQQRNFRNHLSSPYEVFRVSIKSLIKNIVVIHIEILLLDPFYTSLFTPVM